MYEKGVPVQPPVKLEREVEGAGNWTRKYWIWQPGKNYRWAKTITGTNYIWSSTIALGRTISEHEINKVPPKLNSLTYFRQCRTDSQAGRSGGWQTQVRTPWSHEARPGVNLCTSIFHTFFCFLMFVVFPWDRIIMKQCAVTWIKLILQMPYPMRQVNTEEQTSKKTSTSRLPAAFPKSSIFCHWK